MQLTQICEQYTPTEKLIRYAEKEQIYYEFCRQHQKDCLFYLSYESCDVGVCELKPQGSIDALTE